MPVSLDDILANMTPEERARIAQRSQDMIAEETALRAALEEEEAAERIALSGGALEFLVYRDEGGAFHFRLVGPAGVALLESPAFVDKSQARAALEAFRRRVTEAAFTDQTEAA